ncbi:DZF domain-containing protein [Aphelenchoides fujianensis]|nr:DZF domain-containing protein [Aphelenchoides fujianensis]
MYGYQNANVPPPANYQYEQIFGVNNDPYSGSQPYQHCLTAFNPQFTAQPPQPSAQMNASIAAGYGGGLIEAFPAVQYAPPPHAMAAVETPAYGAYDQSMMQQQVRFPQPARPFGFQQPRMPQPKRSFHPFPNNRPPAGFQKRKPPPKPPVDPAKFFCEICSITCGSAQAFQDHLGGKSHKRKEELSKGNGQPLAKNKSSYMCSICNVTSTGKEAFNTHLQGIKHSRAIKNLQKLGKALPEKISSVFNPNGQAVVDGAVEAEAPNGEAANEEEDSSEMDVAVGEEYVEVIEGVSAKQTQFRCNLCDCVCGDPVAKSLHVRGRRHRMQYKQKVDSSVFVDPKAGARGRQRKVRENQLPANLDQLRPDAKTFEEIDGLLMTVERALKSISDRLTEETNGSVEGEKPEPLLKGVFRTGPLGDRLLLKSDRQLKTLLMCAKKPTTTLLQRIVDDFLNHVEDEEIKKKTKGGAECRQGGFFGPNTSREEPAEVLACDEAMADYRHTEFFQNQCWSIPAFSETAALLRDVRLRYEALNHLSFHSMKLILVPNVRLERPPAAGLRRVPPVLRARTKLLDPTLTEDVDMMGALSTQQREDVVACAQEIVRLIAFDQIHATPKKEKKDETEEPAVEQPPTEKQEEE